MTRSSAHIAGWTPCPFPWPEVNGLFVGGCIAGGPLETPAIRGHLHMEFPRAGVICLRDASMLFDEFGGPSYTMHHEYAHLLTGRDHDKVWAAQMLRFGYFVDVTNAPCRSMP